MADEEEKPQEPKKSSKLRWVIFAVVGFLLLVGAGFATVQFVLPQTRESPDPQAAPDPKADMLPFEFKLPEIIVNVDEGRLERMLKVLIVLEIPVEDEEHSLKLSEMLSKHQSEIKDRLITMFAGKSLDELGGGSEAKSALKSEVKKTLDDLLLKDSNKGIRRVFFDTFVVQ